MTLKNKIEQFKSDYKESEEISSNMLSPLEKEAFEIIEELEKLIEEQFQANRESIIAIGDHGTMKNMERQSISGELDTKVFAQFLARLKDNNTSVEKQLEKSFYSLQKVIKKKNEML